MRRFKLAPLAGVLLFILSLSVVHALAVEVATNPPVLRPGTTGQLILYITSTVPATHIRVRIGETPLSIEGKESSVDIGDVYGGTISYPLGLSVPSNVSPGTYYVPIEIDYDSGGQSYEEHFTAKIEVLPEGDVHVAFPAYVEDGKINHVTLWIETGMKLYDTSLIVSGGLTQPVYVGDIEGNVPVEVNILPICKNGFYTMDVNVISANYTGSFAKLVRCKGTSGINVYFSLPKYIAPGEYNGVLRIENTSDMATGPLVVSLKGINTTLAGKTVYTINNIPGGESVSIPVTYYVSKPGTAGISVTIHEGNIALEYAFTAIVRTEPDIVVYIASEPKLSPTGVTVSIGVANRGNGKAGDVSLYVDSPAVISGKFSTIGDLEAGDYDTADVVLEKEVNTLPLTITYYVRGVKHVIHTSVHVVYPPQGSSAPWIILGIIVVAAFIIWRRRRR